MHVAPIHFNSLPVSGGLLSFRKCDTPTDMRIAMNHHPIINNKCSHCEKFRLAYEVIDGVCSWASPVRKPGPSQEVIQKAVQDMEKRKLVTRGHHGWNK